jgi:hypothetical protein
MCDVSVLPTFALFLRLHKTSPIWFTRQNTMLRQAHQRNLFQQPYVSAQHWRSLPNSSQFRRRDDKGSESEDEDSEKEKAESDDDVDDDNDDDEQEHEDVIKSTIEDDDDNFDLTYNNLTGPLEQWGNKCQAKIAIIAELKKNVSLIHQYIPDGEK